MTCRYHKVHAEESHQNKFVELTLADCHFITLHPFCTLKEHDEHTDVQYCLQCICGGIVDIHSTEYQFPVGRKKPDGDGAESEKYGGEWCQYLFTLLTGECVE